MSAADYKVDLGLAEFVAKLISETMDAVTTSLVDQAHKRAALAENAALDLREFAARNVAEAEVDRELGGLFPSEEEGVAHTIVEGARYLPPGPEGTGERPPIRELLGLSLGRDDLLRSKSGVQLTAAGVARIRDAVRLLVGRSMQESLGAVLREGLPTVVVDSGRIASKVTFEVHELEPEAEAQPQPSATTPKFARLSRPLIAKQALPIESLLPPNVRMVVKQADSKAPQTQASGQVFGEIEITFKTVR